MERTMRREQRTSMPRPRQAPLFTNGLTDLAHELTAALPALCLSCGLLKEGSKAKRPSQIAVLLPPVSSSLSIAAAPT